MSLLLTVALAVTCLVDSGAARASAPTGLAADFAFKAVSDLVRHQLDKPDEMAASESHFTSEVAASFGDLSTASCKKMDDNLKIAIAGVETELAALEEKSWSNVVGVVKNSVFLRPFESPVSRELSFSKKRTSYFSHRTSEAKKAIHKWFNEELIQDDDVMQATHIDFHELASIFGGRRVGIKTGWHIFARSAKNQATVLDLGVLRYPDLASPYFKLYRLKIMIEWKHYRVLFITTNRSTAKGEFDSQKFMPDVDVAIGMSRKARKAAISKANALILGLA